MQFQASYVFIHCMGLSPGNLDNIRYKLCLMTIFYEYKPSFSGSLNGMDSPIKLFGNISLLFKNYPFLSRTFPFHKESYGYQGIFSSIPENFYELEVHYFYQELNCN